MDSWTRTYFGSLFVVLTLISVVPAQDDSGFLGQAGNATAGAEQKVIRMVRLSPDGNVQGHLRILYPTGKTAPANAEIAFAQSGTILQATKTDAEGIFQTANLQPGLYTATVTIDNGSTISTSMSCLSMQTPPRNIRCS